MSENGSTPDSEQELHEHQEHGGPWATLTAGIRKLADIAVRAPLGLTPQKRAVFMLVCVVAIVAFVAIVCMTLTTNAPYLFWAFLGFLVFAAVVTLWFLGTKQLAQDKDMATESRDRSQRNLVIRQSTERSERQAAQEIDRTGSLRWTRKVIALPLPDDRNRREITRDLEAIQESAFQRLLEARRNIRKDQIRVNIFLAKYEEAGNGVVCMLRMPPEFRVNMAGHSDEEIAFRPGEGATGKAFVEHRTHVALYDKERRKWDDQYTLNVYQKGKIHTDLRWIISYPLANEEEEAMAVLNIDCLGCDVAEGELHALKDAIQKDVDVVQAKLNQFYAKVKISIIVEPVPQEA